MNKGGRPKRKISIDGQILTDARLKANMSLSDVAAKLGVNRSTVSRWERGIQAPRPEDILKMMMLYDADNGIVKK